MDEKTILLQEAQKNAVRFGVSYAGALSPRDAFSLCRLAPVAKIVDVRTRAELEWVGRVPGAVEIEWKLWPEGELNPDFILELRQRCSAEDVLLFLCRSGIRSHHAAQAATEAGFPVCINVLEGFEGDLDTNAQRGHLGGWRFAGLPWVQG